MVNHILVFMYDFHRGFGEECLQAANLVQRRDYTFPHCLNSRRLPHLLITNLRMASFAVLLDLRARENVY